MLLAVFAQILLVALYQFLPGIHLLANALNIRLWYSVYCISVTVFD